MSKILYTDLMEFSTDELAQTAWVSDADSPLPSAEYSVGDGIDSYTKLLLHANGGDATTRFIDNANDDQDGNNCVLMLHFDGADTATSTIDASLSNHTVTFVGNAQLDTAQSKFGSASLLCDGTGDYISLEDSADFNFGTGDFTIDFWVRFATIPATDSDYQFLWSQYEDSGDYAYCNLYNNGTGKTTLGFGLRLDGVDKGVYIMTNDWATLATDTWYHLAFERTTTTGKIFIDGVSQTLTESTAFGTNDVGDKAGPWIVGGHTLNPNNGMNGWIDEFRISKGTALWTANFTAPIASPSPKLVTAVADAQIDTAQKVFGTGSVLFDGTGDYLTIPASADWNFGAGDFTIDLWVRFNALPPADTNHMLFLESIVLDPINYWQFLIYNVAGQLQFWFNAIGRNDYKKDWTPVVNIWYHITFIRNGNTSTGYVDGVSLGDVSDSNDMPNVANVLSIGARYDGTVPLNGWIDELRISKGIARWTSNFDALNLQCYSEATIKEQGSYSLKAEATTGALNDTLTKTLTDYLDYSVMDVIKFSVRASRTGSNIKLKIHDTGGTTSEHTINIASADTWQTEIFDISAITTTNRDTIDKIIIEIINADVANTIYIDNLFSKAIVESSHVWVG